MNPSQILSECKSLAFLLLFHLKGIAFIPLLISMLIEYDLIEQSNQKVSA